MNDNLNYNRTVSKKQKKKKERNDGVILGANKGSRAK